MQDLMWVAVGVAFFALSIEYVEFCDRVGIGDYARNQRFDFDLFDLRPAAADTGGTRVLSD
jgi:hypothetical protein